MKEIGEFEFQEICKRKPECYCPPRHILNHKLSNTPEYLRRYLTELAKQELLDDVNKELKYTLKAFRKSMQEHKIKSKVQNNLIISFFHDTPLLAMGLR